jgi:CheY-like chemotaxis protein
VLANIFIVDDHDHIRRHLRRLIEMQPAVCCEAVSGKEAVAKYSRDAHVTLMDFNMPGNGRVEGFAFDSLEVPGCFDPDGDGFLVYPVMRRSPESGPQGSLFQE